MVRARTIALATCAALLALPAVAQAQGGLTGRVRYLAGHTYQDPEIFDSHHDFWTGVVPEVSYLVLQRRWQLRTTYAFTAAAHTNFPAEIANRLTTVSNFELSRRTSLLLSADANQTSLSNYLITRPVTDTSALVVPPANTRLLTLTASQGISWEASPNVLVGQGADVVYVTSLDPQLRIANVSAGGTFTVERTFKRDAVGVEARGGWVGIDAPPAISGRFITASLAPRWRHDINPEWSTTVSAGATVVMSPEGGTDPIVTPSGRAAVLYTLESSSAELSYAAGATASILIGQMLRSHLVTLRGLTPLSEPNRVFIGGSVGYLNGRTIDLRDDPTIPTLQFNAFLADVDVTWQATDWLQLFAREVFIAQHNGSDAPPFFRQAILVGLQLSTSSPDGVNIPIRFPQRVDRGDAPRR